jgi:hypothetical protein
MTLLSDEWGRNADVIGGEARLGDFMLSLNYKTKREL